MRTNPYIVIRNLSEAIITGTISYFDCFKEHNQRLDVICVHMDGYLYLPLQACGSKVVLYYLDTFNCPIPFAVLGELQLGEDLIEIVGTRVLPIIQKLSVANESLKMIAANTKKIKLHFSIMH